MKPYKRVLLIVVVVLTILSLLLSACGPLDNVNSGRDKDKDNDKDKNKDKNHESEDDGDPGAGAKILICHKTGSAENPYVLINVSENGVKHGHSKHAGDIIPAPADGCPGTSISNGDGEGGKDSNGNKVTICHKTGSAENPYVLITVSENGVKHGHSKHAGDIIPAPADGCPELP